MIEIILISLFRGNAGEALLAPSKRKGCISSQVAGLYDDDNRWVKRDDQERHDGCLLTISTLLHLQHEFIKLSALLSSAYISYAIP